VSRLVCLYLGVAPGGHTGGELSAGPCTTRVGAASSQRHNDICRKPIVVAECGESSRRQGYDGAVADCLFCKIVAGEIPAERVAESSRTLAFRDINPQAPTHVLVIPKDHYPDLASLASSDADLLAEVAVQARQVADAEGIAAGGYRVVFNTGAGAGQTVFHVHAHVLGGRRMAWPPG
jgi:histidine triad (HIT) family protein